MNVKAVENFAINVRWIIEHNEEFSQDRIAKKAGLTKASLNRILRRMSVPGLDTCEAIADAIAVPLSTLIEDPAKILSEVA